MKRATVTVQITFDPTVNAAYIQLAHEPVMGWAHGTTIPVVLDGSSGTVNIDVDADGRLMGVEILGAQDHLPTAMLAALGPDD